MSNRRMVAAALMSIPVGLMGGWLYSVYELSEREKREFERQCRMVVQERLRQDLPVDVDTIIKDVREMQKMRARQQQ